MRARNRSVASIVALVLAFVGVGAVAVTHPEDASAAPNDYVTMPDGVEIAVNVHFPDGYEVGRSYPTLFEMNGYDGGSASGGTLLNDLGLNDLPVLPADDSHQITRQFHDEYVTVHTSVRGTGCSGGEFDLFSTIAAQDGRYIIDEWIAEQPWSNGDVAIIGHSYGGITGFLIAATQPNHLRAASLSGLIDDMYRGMVYPGGVSNYGFPLLWTGALRPVYDILGGAAPGLVREETDDEVEQRRLRCANNQLTKRRAIADDPLVQGLAQTDNAWFRARSLVTYVDDIDVPIHITGAYQDEQTGPRFPNLFEKVRGVPKRLVMTNGDHNTQNPGYAGVEVWTDRKSWIDHFTGVRHDPQLGSVAQARSSVTTLLETHRNSDGALVSNGRLDSTSFPLENTSWTRYYLRGNGGLATSKPGLFDSGSDSYLSGSRRQAWSYQAGPALGPPFTTADGPDEVMYRTSPVTQPTAVVGPITATLFLQTAGVDTELFVQLIDEAPDGSRTYLQRGLLKASHHAIDTSRSDHAGGVMYRPWRPHTNPQLITPLAINKYVVEVFPVGHVIRPGHRLMVKISAPPVLDSYYAYVPTTLPTVNTVLRTQSFASHLTLPIVPLQGVALGPALPCGAQEAVRCIAAPNG